MNDKNIFTVIMGNLPKKARAEITISPERQGSYLTGRIKFS